MSNTTLRFELDYRYFSTPLGWLLVAASKGGMCLVHFCGSETPAREFCRGFLQEAFPHARATFDPSRSLLCEAEGAILDYLHHRQPIPAFPLDMRAGTLFQRKIWEILCGIPFGETRSYLHVARSAGRPQAARAVGQACGRNPMLLLIPCHRVVAADGRLGGFSAGLHLKQSLLALELDRGAPDNQHWN